MKYKIKKIDDLVTYTEAANIRGCSQQAIAELAKKNRFTKYIISDRNFLSREEVTRYTPAPTGRPKKAKKQVPSAKKTPSKKAPS
jgi:hypothetical protein